MKKRISLFSLTAVVSLMLIMSCTNEGPDQQTVAKTTSKNSAARLSSFDLSTAKADFLRIMASTAWINHNNAAKAFAIQLNGVRVSLPTLQDRNAFQSFVGANLTSTKWTSIAAAMSQYDAVVALGNILNNATAPFMNTLSNADLSDITQILAPATSVPQTGTGSGPCQDGCNIAYNTEFNEANADWGLEVFQAAKARNIAAIPAICQYWKCVLAEVTLNHDNCLGACS